MRYIKDNYVKSKKIHYIAQIGLLFSLTIVLSFLENLIPPIPTLPPGIKLGLSNTVLMYTVFFVNKRSAFTLTFLKSLFVFLTRGATAFLLSLAGGILSIIVIILLLGLKKVELSCIIISVSGAIAHNIAQLIVSAVLMSSVSVFFYTPILVISGVIMGIVTGTVLKIMLPAMKKLGFN